MTTLNVNIHAKVQVRYNSFVLVPAIPTPSHATPPNLLGCPSTSSTLPCGVELGQGAERKLGEVMKTNGCHYERFTSYHTGSITKPDKALSSWPTWQRVEPLHLCFYFFILRDWDVMTCHSATPKGKMCQMWYCIAQWVECNTNTSTLFPTRPNHALKYKRCFG